MDANHRDLLEAALVGFTLQQKTIDAKIEEIKSKLGSPATHSAESTPSEKRPRKRRRFSKETRLKMAEAQKRRWAARKQ